MIKIYTKKGDGGRTRIVGGKMLLKNSARIEAYGNVDELDSLIGTSFSKISDKKLRKKLVRVQEELLILGSDLATPIDSKLKIPRISATYVKKLEKEIDEWDKKIPRLSNFVLPGGGELGSKFHLARTVARRTERSIVALSETEKINKHILPYINRLSDWLFVLARLVNNIKGTAEIIWKVRK